MESMLCIVENDIEGWQLLTEFWNFGFCRSATYLQPGSGVLASCGKLTRDFKSSDLISATYLRYNMILTV